MEYSKQVEAVKKALELEKSIDNAKYELSQQFDDVPNPPIHHVIDRVYPEIVPPTQFNWALAIIPSLFFLPWGFIYYFVIYKKKREEEIERIRNSVEYKNQCIQVDKDFDRMQADADATYQNQMEEYNVVTLPNYEKELEKWNDFQNKLRDNLGYMQNELHNHYETTKIVPVQYRSIYALQHIYDVVSTSNFDVQYAIDDYNKNEQRILEEAKLYQQQQANMLADEQNALLQEQNEISAKARRDANIAAVVGTVQRHNTNKRLDKIIKG